MEQLMKKAQSTFGYTDYETLLGAFKEKIFGIL